MRVLDFPLLADENIHPEVIETLVARSRAIVSVVSLGLQAKSDREILAYAPTRSWVVLTHDSDFGSLAIRDGEPYTGILFLRPGHISPHFVLETLDALAAQSIEVTPPFLVVGERRGEVLRVRVRSGGAEIQS